MQLSNYKDEHNEDKTSYVLLLAGKRSIPEKLHQLILDEVQVTLDTGLLKEVRGIMVSIGPTNEEETLWRMMIDSYSELNFILKKIIDKYDKRYGKYDK